MRPGTYKQSHWFPYPRGITLKLIFLFFLSNTSVNCDLSDWSLSNMFWSKIKSINEWCTYIKCNQQLQIIVFESRKIFVWFCAVKTMFYDTFMVTFYLFCVQVVAWTLIQNSEIYHVVIVCHRCKHKRFEYRLILVWFCGVERNRMSILNRML